MKYLFTLLLVCSVAFLQAQSDKITTKKGDITIHPVLHASMVIEWQGKTIYIDPYGGAEKYATFAKPDLILITDIHGDHMNTATLDALDKSQATLIAPSAVVEVLKEVSFQSVMALKNDAKTKWMDIQVEAIPMYNLPETNDSRHPKGRGNGYVLTIGGKRLYISGDTEDIAEMRVLKKIDIAFVCMNLPYTMEVSQAASAVLEFQPKIVYPFHFRGSGGLSDVEAFKSEVEKGNKKIEVRLREWYKE
jgi:L-ascorbate metabolism protein UlaG (beta-lactamase superfamily)